MRSGVIALVAIMVPASVTSLDCGIIRVSPQNTPAPTATPTATSDWAGNLDAAWRLHRAGEFSLAIQEYDKVLEFLPLNDAPLAIRAGVNIHKGEAYLLNESGLGAVDASMKADTLLEQANEVEKQGMEWKLMWGQAATVTAAGLLYAAIDGDKAVDKALELLQNSVNLVGLPETHFFLGMGYAKLGMFTPAKREFQMFLEAPAILVTFMGEDTMRQLATSWIEKL